MEDCPQGRPTRKALGVKKIQGIAAHIQIDQTFMERKRNVKREWKDSLLATKLSRSKIVTRSRSASLAKSSSEEGSQETQSSGEEENEGVHKQRMQTVERLKPCRVVPKSLYQCKADDCEFVFQTG